MRFSMLPCPHSRARSPRIEPGTACVGLVAPARARTPSTTFLPLKIPARHVLDDVGEERLVGHMRVVLAQQILGGAHESELLEDVALGLDAAQDLTDETPFHAVGFD